MQLVQAPLAAQPLALAWVAGLLDQAAERVGLTAQLDLGRQDLGVSEHLASEAQVGWHAGKILEFERPARPGQIVELAPFHRLRDLGLRDPLKDAHQARL